MIAFIDYRTTDTEKNSLQTLGFTCISIPQSKLLYSAIDGHADIQLNILSTSERKVIVQQNIPNSFITLLDKHGISYIKSHSKLISKYPNNIFLNAAIIDDYLIHNLKYTDKNLLNNVDIKNLINVNQGYSKCSILPIRNKALITNDSGIYSTLNNENFDVLLLPPGDILLPNLNYGFIGGVGGKLNDDSIGFFGDLSYYQHGDKVKKFLYKYDVKPFYLYSGKLIDRGSLLTL